MKLNRKVHVKVALQSDHLFNLSHKPFRYDHRILSITSIHGIHIQFNNAVIRLV